MIVKCFYCGIEVDRRPSDLKTRKHIFCSRECHYKWKSENKKGENNHNFSSVNYHCDNCNKEFLVRPYILKELKEGKRKNIFCSRKCHDEFRRNKKTIRTTPIEGKFEIECRYCGKKFLVNHYDVERAKFCSRECGDKYRINRVKLKCLNCDEEFGCLPCMSDKRKFCSKKCVSEWQSKNNNTKIKKICLICEKEYYVSPTFSESIVCSKKCQGKWYHQVYAKRPEVIKRKRKEGIKSVNSQKRKDTKPELMVREYLINNNIDFIPQRLFYNKYLVDFYLPKLDIIIEVQGDYWHANPEKFGDTEGKKPLTKKQKIRVEKDKIRYDDLASHGHNVYFIWEKDIYEDINKALSLLDLIKII